MATQIVIQVPSAATVAGKTGKDAQAEVDTIVHEILASKDFAATKNKLTGLEKPDVSVEEAASRSDAALHANFTPGSGVKGLSDDEIDAEVTKWAAYGTGSRKTSGISSIAIDSIGTEEAIKAAGCYCRWRRSC